MKPTSKQNNLFNILLPKYIYYIYIIAVFLFTPP